MAVTGCNLEHWRSCHVYKQEVGHFASFLIYMTVVVPVGNLGKRGNKTWEVWQVPYPGHHR